MLTLGTTAPLESVTVPTIVAVVWARAAAENKSITRRLFLSRILSLTLANEFATAYHSGRCDKLDRSCSASAELLPLVRTPPGCFQPLGPWDCRRTHSPSDQCG